MTLGSLQRLLSTTPEVVDYRVRVLRKASEDFQKLPVLRLEFDSSDSDLNLVVHDSRPTGETIELFKDLVTSASSHASHDGTPLFMRQYFNPPLEVAETYFTHIDTPIYSYATQPETKTVGLFPWFDGIEKMFQEI